jgi:hypothetical protein
MPHYRKCPECGYVDPVAWRGSSYDPDREFADFYEFQKAHPEIAVKILRLGTKHHVVAGDFVYWRSGRMGVVQRIPLVVYEANGRKCRGGKGTYVEKYRPPEGDQKLLMEAAKQ